MTTSTNERTNALLYKNISLTRYSRKGWCWLCVRCSLETGRDCYILTPSSSGHSSISFSSWQGCSTVGHWGPKALCLPLVLTLASCLQLAPTPTGSSRLFDVHLLPLFFRLFTQVHILIDGSVESQYVTKGDTKKDNVNILCVSWFLWRGEIE